MLSQPEEDPGRYVEPGISFPLYKFTEREHALSFLETGEMRLGTLFDYRDDELHGEGILDGTEGIANFNWSSPVGRVDYSPTARNNWIFCCSEFCNTHLWREFEDADCCYVINDIGFFDAIDRVVNKAAEEDCLSLLVRKIRYAEGKSVPIEGYDFVGAIKEARFERQREIRAFWEPRGEPTINTDSAAYASPEEFVNEYVKEERRRVRPMIIDVPEARDHCLPELIPRPPGI